MTTWELDKIIIEERFWTKVRKSSESECWEWTGAKFRTGYGAFRFERRAVTAHRMVWFLTHAQWPQLLICHRCDNKLCVNPAHLFEGTSLDNVRDAISKGRARHVGPRPERVNTVKLTWEIVRQIRLVWKEQTMSLSGMANHYGVGFRAIWNIVHNRTWRNDNGVA